jgi:hypothetical protein
MASRKPWGDLTALRYLGQGLADAKDQRIRTNNRFERGGTAISAELTAAVSATADHSEDQYERMLMDEYRRRVPDHVREWAAAIPGLASGELFPRIIAAIGHPRTASPELPDPDNKGKMLIGEPYERSPAQLRQYCGAGDPQRKPRKDMPQAELFAMGKVTQVRPLLYTWSSTLVKIATPGGQHTRKPGQPKSRAAADSEWWDVFSAAKRRYSGHEGRCAEGFPSPCSATHNRHQWTCKNTKRPPQRSNGCGVGAHPEWGESGSPWRPGHIDMAAHRKLHQFFLDQLWAVSAESEE